MLDLIHHMDVVDQLIAAGTSSAGEWQWRKQLRFGAGADGKVTIHMVSASFDYTYEYQGNAPKLVHTPLTDKCYLTLTQAMFMGYGGNPYGPAGTGKTESVKALGGAFGRQVLVFNCDEGIDSKSMGRIFMGLVKCGAWGCFDEFNRLLPDQLSEISQQIQVIQAAIKARQPRMELEGTTTEVDANAGIFVTMNPAGKGYGGRSKLPDNLKALFRAVAMSAPNNEMIAEVMLYSEGFAHAKALAVKLVAIFSLSKQLLSPQQHYDWGLRALKTVLRVGGQLVAAEKKTRGGAALDEAEEAMLVIKALRVNTLSKLTHGDTAAFNALVGDVFPDAVPQDVAYDQLEAALKEVIWPRRGSRHATPHLTPHVPIPPFTGDGRREARGAAVAGEEDPAVLRGDAAADGRRHRRPVGLRQVDDLADAQGRTAQARPEDTDVRDEPEVDAARAGTRPRTARPCSAAHTPHATPRPTPHLSPGLGRRASSSSATWIWTHASGSTAC